MKNLAWLILTVALPATMACVIEPGTVGSPGDAANRVALTQRYTVDCGTRSPSGYGAGFHDPRNNGECWACPNSNPVRTWAAVDADNACATKAVLGIGATPARAKFLGPHPCPEGDVQKDGYCHYCPAGSSWNADEGSCIK